MLDVTSRFKRRKFLLYGQLSMILCSPPFLGFVPPVGKHVSQGEEEEEGEEDGEGKIELACISR